MVSQTGLAYTDLQTEWGITFPASADGEEPAQTTITSWIETITERDLRRWLEVTALTSGDVDQKAALTSLVKDKLNWWHWWKRTKGSGQITLPNGTVTYLKEPKYPSHDSRLLIQECRATSRFMPIDAVTD